MKKILLILTILGVLGGTAFYFSNSGLFQGSFPAKRWANEGAIPGSENSEVLEISDPSEVDSASFGVFKVYFDTDYGEEIDASEFLDVANDISVYVYDDSSKTNVLYGYTYDAEENFYALFVSLDNKYYSITADVGEYVTTSGSLFEPKDISEYASVPRTPFNIDYPYTILLRDPTLSGIDALITDATVTLGTTACDTLSLGYYGCLNPINDTDFTLSGASTTYGAISTTIADFTERAADTDSAQSATVELTLSTGETEEAAEECSPYCIVLKITDSTGAEITGLTEENIIVAGTKAKILNRDSVAESVSESETEPGLYYITMLGEFDYLVSVQADGYTSPDPTRYTASNDTTTSNDVTLEASTEEGEASSEDTYMIKINLYDQNPNAETYTVDAPNAISGLDYTNFRAAITTSNISRTENVITEEGMVVEDVANYGSYDITVPIAGDYRIEIAVDGFENYSENGISAGTTDTVEAKDIGLNYAYYINVSDADGNALSGATVSAGTDTECTDLERSITYTGGVTTAITNTGLYGCPVPVEDEVFTYTVVMDGYEDYTTGTFKEDRATQRDASIQAEAVLTATTDSTDEESTESNEDSALIKVTTLETGESEIDWDTETELTLGAWNLEANADTEWTGVFANADDISYYIKNMDDETYALENYFENLTYEYSYYEPSYDKDTQAEFSLSSAEGFTLYPDDGTNDMYYYLTLKGTPITTMATDFQANFEGEEVLIHISEITEAELTETYLYESDPTQFYFEDGDYTYGGYTLNSLGYEAPDPTYGLKLEITDTYGEPISGLTADTLQLIEKGSKENEVTEVTETEEGIYEIGLDISGKYAVYADGYVLDTSTTVEAVLWESIADNSGSISLDYGYFVIVEDSSANRLAGATVLMGDDLDITCVDSSEYTEEADEEAWYGCAVPLAETSTAFTISLDGYEDATGDFTDGEYTDRETEIEGPNFVSAALTASSEDTADDASDSDDSSSDSDDSSSSDDEDSSSTEASSRPSSSSSSDDDEDDEDSDDEDSDEEEDEDEEDDDSLSEIFSSEKYECSDPFTDTSNHWAEDKICRLYNAGIVNGKSSTRYAPSDYTTRAEFLKLALVNAGYEEEDGYGLTESYTDVNSGDWYYYWIVIGENEGFLRNAGGAFSPNTSISRADATLFAVRVAKQTLYGFTQSDIAFSDVVTSDYFAYAVIIANNTSVEVPNDGEEAIVGGYSDGTFRPYNYISRGEVASLILRAAIAWYQ